MGFPEFYTLTEVFVNMYSSFFGTCRAANIASKKFDLKNPSIGVMLRIYNICVGRTEI